ncbi:Peroxisomal membrane protein 13 [Platanthera zijinensis]|uniref:Peroxin-13 n=1 Tax=Platanthera zijinensis TaxID=2320716 RepID=A0AAP0C582_9ASPA
MASNSQQPGMKGSLGAPVEVLLCDPEVTGSSPGNNPPPKPWEQAATSSGPTPFRPSTPGSTSVVVETSGTAKPGELYSNTGSTAANPSIVTRPLPSRPWDQNYGSSYGGYGSNMSYNTGYGSGYGSSMYGSSGGLGGSYGSGLYGNSMYRGGYGGLSGGYGTYGGMSNSGFGGTMGGYGNGGPYGNPDPNNPYGQPPSPPGFWVSFLRVMHGVVNFFGRVSMLIDQNTQAFHFFMTALLQLFDRSGMLYGELARFVLRLLGIRTKSKQKQHQPGLDQLESADKGRQQPFLDGPKAPGPSWDSVWGGDDAPKGAR